MNIDQLTTKQAKAIEYINFVDRPVASKEVGDMLSIKASAAQVVMRQLYYQGFLQRRLKSLDGGGQAWLYSLTKQTQPESGSS